MVGSVAGLVTGLVAGLLTGWVAEAELAVRVVYLTSFTGRMVSAPTSTMAAPARYSKVWLCLPTTAMSAAPRNGASDCGAVIRGSKQVTPGDRAGRIGPTLPQ